ncbi:MAG: threonine synthase [Bacteroidales bacterium OttesenSCG-928-I14]|jgi:threonine synthase|nr:threonine synthase [Bacteroidales bacterium OttesenSCG-928-I14]
MEYYSTHKQTSFTSLKQAIIKGLANDGGLYMPKNIVPLDNYIISTMKDMNFQQIGTIVAQSLFGDSIETNILEYIVNETIKFNTPIVNIHDNIYSLELFYGPTLAFKDIGARFMALLLKYFIEKEEVENINVLVATSGDTGSAVANGFLGIKGINVYILYPKNRVSIAQEYQFTTLGQNIFALEINGTFDDCQALVKSAFIDKELNTKKLLTSANSINIARLLPQSFYYFNAYSQLDKINKAKELVISVPSGNFGNLCAGLIANKMGLPIKHFIAANNKNNVFFNYLNTGIYAPQPAVETYANAMDVGNPSNFERIIDLFSSYVNPYQAITKQISGFSYTDEDITKTIQYAYDKYEYILDPHGATAYQALLDKSLSAKESGVFLETAHPAKFKNIIDSILGIKIPIPNKLKSFMEGEKHTIELENDFIEFKNYLLQQ